MKAVNVTNTARYAGTGQATHLLSYCAWSGVKIAVSNLYHQFPTIRHSFLPAEHPALAVPMLVWEKNWQRITEYGTETEQYLAIISVLKHLGVLVLGDESCSQCNKLPEIMVMIGEDILPNLRYISVKSLPKARTNQNLSLHDFVTNVSCSLLRKSNPTMKTQWEEDLDRTVAKLMREVTGGKLKPAKMAQWSTEMLKAYTGATQAQRELIAECIVKPYHKITIAEYMWAIEYLRINLPISVTDVTSASVGRSIQSSTIIQWLTEKVAMLQPDVDMFSIIDLDSDTESEHGACERPAPSTQSPAAPAKAITISAATAVAFDAVAYAAFPLTQPSGLPYPSEMHRKIAFNKQQRALAAATTKQEGTDNV